MSLFPATYNGADVTTGHGCWPPVGYTPPPLGASPNVKMNLGLAHRVGDVTLPHFCTPLDIHPDVIATGYPRVLVNGRPVAITGVSALAPGGLVAGWSTFNVIVAAGNLNTPTAFAQSLNNLNNTPGWTTNPDLLN